MPPGGCLVYTGQPWHPQLELIARALTSHRAGQAWVMRRRTQAEMDQLVEAAGFRKLRQRIDPWGIFTVSLAVREGVWVVGGAVQGACHAALAAVAYALQGLSAGIAIVLLLTLFSLARGACSIAYKDVQGKTIPKTRRGVLSGWIASIAGALSMAVGLGLSLLPESASASVFVGLLGGGAVGRCCGRWPRGRFRALSSFPAPPKAV